MARAYSVGVDLHKQVIQICVLNERGEVVHEERFQGSTREVGDLVLRSLARYRGKKRLVVEAVGMNRWFVDRCREAGIEVLVCDPAKVGLKQSGKKTDRRDALELARRLYLGDIERAARSYYASDEEYGQRKVLRVRHRLVQLRQKTVNQLRGILNAYRESAPVRELWSPRATRWLKQLKLRSPDLEASVQALVGVLEQLQESIAQLERRINERAAESATARLLSEAVPSAGAQTALTLASELGDVSRFDSSRAVVSHAGLAPRVSNSADRQHHGKITKRGNPELRWILCQMAVRLLARDPLVKRWAEPRLKRMHANKVRVALARRLLVGIYHMLRTGEVFCLERCLAL